MEKQLTYGEQIVGVDFNPNGDKKVQKVKELYAEIIDILNKEMRLSTNGIQMEFLVGAISQTTLAQMSAVRGITHKEVIFKE